MSESGGNRSDREVLRAWLCIGGTFVALILNGIWSLFAGTASFGADESDLVQGWEGVLRNLPGYLLLIAVPSLGVRFATRAGIRGADRAKSALAAASLALLFALSAVTRDSAEVVMTTRAATVSWLTFGIDAVIVGLVFVTTRRRFARH